MLQRSAGWLLALGIAATLVAAITAYAAAGVAAYVVRPFAAGPAQQATFIAAEPQVSNRTAKADRVALLLDAPSYTDFNPSLLAVAISSAATAFDRRSDPSGISSGLLNDAQIAGIERRLRLTPRQAQYWPAVAVALRDIGRRYFPPRRQYQNVARKIDMNSPEVQRLIEAATPLILQFSEDQKREVRQLVRIIGLETVASRI